VKPDGAHPNLPFGPWSRGDTRLVNLNWYASMTGSYQEGREIDVSYRVARKIGLIHSGVSQVRLELIQLPEKH